jgi:hypothetical protein
LIAGQTGYVSGGTNVKFVNGIATFNQMYAYCFPGGTMTITYTVSLSGLSTQYDLVTTQFLKFRNCANGEILSGTECSMCKNGTYSLEYTPTAQVRF